MCINVCPVLYYIRRDYSGILKRNTHTHWLLHKRFSEISLLIHHERIIEVENQFKLCMNATGYKNCPKCFPSYWIHIWSLLTTEQQTAVYIPLLVFTATNSWRIRSIVWWAFQGFSLYTLSFIIISHKEKFARRKATLQTNGALSTMKTSGRQMSKYCSQNAVKLQPVSTSPCLNHGFGEA
jgi:hypothetical protein